MDPITIVLIGAIGLGLGLAAVTFWHQILEWSEKNLFPWFDKHLPTVAPHVRQAFSRLDGVVVSVRRAIKAAWNQVSQYLLKQVVELNRQTSNTWIQQVTSWVIEASNYNKPVVKQITTEVKVPFRDLPKDVRQAFLARKDSSFEKDVTKIREEEMALVN